MIAKEQLEALKVVNKFVQSVLDGQMAVGPEEVAKISSAHITTKRLARLFQKATVDQTTLLEREEIIILHWMYEKTEHWKGGLMPDEWPQYDRWLEEARNLLTKLGASANEPAPTRDQLVEELWSKHHFRDDNGSSLMHQFAFASAMREFIERLPAMVLPLRPTFDGTRAEAAAIRAKDSRADVECSVDDTPSRAPRKRATPDAAPAQRRQKLIQAGE